MKRSRSPAELRSEDPSVVGEALFNSMCEALQNAKQGLEDGTISIGSTAVPTRVTSHSFEVLNSLFASFLCEAAREMRQDEDAKALLAAPSGASTTTTSASNTGEFQPSGGAVIELNQHLNIVQRQLRKWAGFGMIGQKVVTPKQSDTFESDVPTFEIDAFLYGTDEDIDNLCDAGKVSRHFCTSCKGIAVAPTQFITHSFSKDQLFYIFCFLIPYLRVVVGGGGGGKAMANNNTITSLVDVGSRLGVVLAAAFFAGSPLSKIVGIEMDQQLCGIQERLIKSHRGMNERVSVVEGDALSEANLAILAESDLVVLHNVFEWFSEERDQLRIWKKLRSALSKRKGQYLLFCPGIEESLRPLVRAFGPEGMVGDPVKKAGRMSEIEIDACISKFLKGWVEEVDCTVALAAFVEERRGALGSNAGGHTHGAECADGSCGHPEEDEVEEFVEHAENIHVYMVV